MGATFAIGAGVLGIGVSGYSAYRQRQDTKKAERRQRRANRIERARAAAEQSVERRRAVAIARQAQARNLAAGVSQGLLEGSSPIQGANSSIQSDLGSSIASANRSFNSSQQSLNQRQSASNSIARGQASAAFANVVSQGFQLGASIYQPTSNIPSTNMQGQATPCTIIQLT